MNHSPEVLVSPTLERMASVYSLSRAGGVNSPRFLAYRSQVERHWGLAAFNPMAGDAAAAAVRALIALCAEDVAAAAAKGVLARCDWRAPLTLAVVLATPGMWTDRLATEVRHRTNAERRDAHGEILLWADDPPSVATIERESIAEAVRTMWTSLHGSASSLHAVLAREGLAYALAGAAPRHQPDGILVPEAIEVLGDTAALGDVVAVLYGDAAAITLGYTPLGLAERAGYGFAIAQAAELIAMIGAAGALRVRT